MTPKSIVPLLDLALQNGPLEAELLGACQRVLRSGKFILGAEVRALEAELAAYTGAAGVVGISSGTDALVVALLALGIGPGDEVLTTPLSFFASVGAILRVGARPTFADVEPGTLTLDPQHIEAALTPKTRAILPVHLFGQPADMTAIVDFARKKRLFVIEDAAQAIGAGISGKQVGTFGDIGCFSFFPSKNLGGFGDGGFVTTSDPDLLTRLQRARSHGFSEKHKSSALGGNYRLDELQAALLRVKLPRLPHWTEGRRRVAERYRGLLTAATQGKGQRLALPVEAPNRFHVWNQFVCQSTDRDALRQHLSRHGIETARYYPLPLHLQPVLESRGYRAGQFPVAEAASAEGLALPIYPELGEDALARVAQAMAAFYATGSKDERTEAAPRLAAAV